jgi:hypothetical protein
MSPHKSRWYERGAIMGRAVILALVLAGGGCAGTQSALSWQYEYARAIPDPEAQATMMGAVAQSAAYVDDMGTLDDALDALEGHPTHDQIASRAAIHLASATHIRDARRVAKRINDPASRQATLDEIAKRTEQSAGENAPAGQPPAGSNATQPAGGPAGQ